MALAGLGAFEYADSCRVVFLRWYTISGTGQLNDPNMTKLK